MAQREDQKNTEHKPHIGKLTRCPLCRPITINKVEYDAFVRLIDNAFEPVADSNVLIGGKKR